MGDGHADGDWGMAFEDTVEVVQVRAFKAKGEVDKLDCCAFLSDWLDLMPQRADPRPASNGGRRTVRFGKGIFRPSRNVATWPTEALRVQNRPSGTLTQEYFRARFNPPLFFLDRGRLRGRRGHPRPTPRTTSTWPSITSAHGMAGTRL